MGVKVSVILPCRNEEETIGKCIKQIKDVFKKEKIKGEIIVSDSSSDNSAEIAKKQKVKLIKHDKVGYGIAILEAIPKAKYDYIIIGDSDGTYDFSEIPKLINKIDEGYDLVIGNRLKGNLKKGSMPWHHRYIGNPLLSSVLNLFFKADIHDAHSGFRIIKKDELFDLKLQTTGMEFASEMIIKAAKNDLKIAEVPVSYSPRKGESKLKSFSDGWRHLRFMLLLSPTYLFFIPGVLLFISGISLLFFQLINSITDLMSLLGSFLTILGYQVFNLGLYSRVYATHSGFETHDDWINMITERITLEKSLMIGFSIILLSSILFFLTETNLTTVAVFFTILVIGFQTLFSSFFTSMMAVEKR